jgi:threonine aldolase
MRQAGLLAAAGIHALDHHYARLEEDHDNARYLARELARIPGVRIDVDAVETNLVYFGIEGREPKWIEERLREKGVWLFAERTREVRAVTHLDVGRDGIDRALAAVRSLM